MIGASSIAFTNSNAQQVRGTVLQADGITPVSGVVVLLLRATGTDSILARSVTGDRGSFALKAPRAMSVRIRVLRIGQYPINMGPYQLTDNQTVTVPVTLIDNPIALSSVDVKGGGRCQVRPDSGLLVAQLFDAARTALFASATLVSDEQSFAQFTLFTRTEDKRGRLFFPVERRTIGGATTRPFASIPADTLAKFGYVIEDKDATSYRAPDAEVLLSDIFLTKHCLQIVAATKERPTSIGIGFRPVDRKRGVTDVRGTLWLDKATSELQALEFTYDPLLDDYSKAGVGGLVEFTKMTSGFWFINRWLIRMPHLAARPIDRLGGLKGEYGVGLLDVDGLQITGGEVQSLRVNNDVMYSSAGASTAGSEARDVTDARASVVSDKSAPASNARLADGPTTRADTIGNASTCGGNTNSDYAGLASGRVYDSQHKPMGGVSVTAEWKQDFRLNGKTDFDWQLRQLETKSDANGGYIICGIPLNSPVSLFATIDRTRTRTSTVRVTPKSSRVSMDLAMFPVLSETVARAEAANAHSAPLMVTDLAGKPIQYAVVVVNGGASRVTNERGQVMIIAPPNDSLQLVARRIGFTAYEGKVSRASATDPYRITLGPSSQKLATVSVTARNGRTPLENTGFYDRMMDVKRGAITGEFFTPEQLEARPATNVSEFLRGSRFVGFLTGSQFHVLTGRAGCAMTIVVDGHRVNGVLTDPKGSPGMDQPVDDLVNFGNVMAIEVYPNAWVSPPEISSQVLGTGLNCGVIAFWTGAR